MNERYTQILAAHAHLSLALVKDLDSLSAHEVGQFAGLEVISIGHSLDSAAAALRLELGDADARAVELSDGVHGGAGGGAVQGDEISGPQERQWLALNAEDCLEVR